MNTLNRKYYSAVFACSVVLGYLQPVVAGTDVYFNPLTQSAAVASPNHVNELNSPWLVPAGITQVNLTSMKEIEADISGQSVTRVSGNGSGNSPSNATMWDMISFDDTGKYIFIPHETLAGAGVTRYDSENDFAEILFRGDEGGLHGDWSRDWGAFDPSTYTPNGTLFLAEEWSGEGRVIEVLNPKAPVQDIQIHELNSIANVAHEGLRFSADGRTLYYVDEWNSGSVYKFISKIVGDYTKGQTFVLSVDAYNGNAADNYNEPSNANALRTGLASWIPLTNKDGSRILTHADPFKNGPTNDPRTNNDTRGGRVAADEVGATPYGRPEDIEVGKLLNGNEVVYFAATSENAIYAIEILNDKKAIVKLSVQAGQTPQNLGYTPTTGVLNSPDNLAQDALGNIYIVEDAPNNSNIGGDIWFLRDVNTDGIAESIDHFMSIQVDGSEATGMIFNPRNPVEFIVAVQHPDSTNLVQVPNGFGDSLWKFDLTNVVPPACQKERERKISVKHGQQRSVRTCSRDHYFNFVSALQRPAR